MLYFIRSNLSTIIVGMAIAVPVVIIAIKIIRDKITGKRECSCGCEDCPSKNNCK